MCGIHPQSIRLIRKRKTGKYRIQFISLTLASSFKGNVAKHFCGKKKHQFGLDGRFSLFLLTSFVYYYLSKLGVVHHQKLVNVQRNKRKW